MQKVLFLSLIFLSHAFSLPIDSKLSVRILETTQSGKTILINRGSSDNLNVGDHAKFYITEAIVARAVIVKLKQNTSIWSVYRMVNPDLVINDASLKLKITPAVKLSNNPYSMLSTDSIKGLNLVSGSGDDYKVYSDLLDDRDYSDSDVAEITSRNDASNFRKGRSLKGRPFEFWTNLGFHFYSSQVNANSTYDGSELVGRFTLGLELYLGRWFSIAPQGSYMQDSLLSYDGAVTDSILYEYGGALNFYLFTSPHETYKLIPYISLGAAIGNIVDSFASGTVAGSSSGSSTTVEASGTTFAYFGGLGLKYYFDNKLGVRMLLDAYRRVDVFDELPSSATEDEWDRWRFGPRLAFGFMYRF